MNCQECGAPASGEDLFCGECGAILASPSPEEQAGAPISDIMPEPVSLAPPPRSSFDAPPARDARANASFVLGIISIVVAVVVACSPLSGGILGCIAPIPGIIAIILGGVAQRDIKARGGAQEDWKRARQGMILGIVGTAIYFVIFAGIILFSLGISFLERY